MRGVKAKRIRRELRAAGIPISSDPYTRKRNGQIIASRGRRLYQKVKAKA